MTFDRITTDRKVLGGVPCVADTRIPVATVVGLLGQGHGVCEVIDEYPSLTMEDVLAGLRFAARAVNEREPRG